MNKKSPRRHRKTSHRQAAKSAQRRSVRRQARLDFQTLEPRNLLASVSGLWLVNADSDTDIAALTDGAQIDVQSLATSNLNVRATTDAPVNNVQFSLTGPTSHTQTENIAPYALFGDSSGDFEAGSLPVGQYTLVVTPNSGGADTPLTISFEVVGDTTTPTSGVYLEDNGLVVMEMENTPSGLGLWEERTDHSGYTGDGYLQFFGNTFVNGPPNSPVEYKFTIETPGLYYLHLRSRKDNSADPTRTDISNDAYVRVEGDYTAGAGPHDSHGDNASLSLLQSDTKFFGGSLNNFRWDSGNQLDPGGETNKRVAVYNFKAGEEYTLVVSGRSKFYSIDRIVFRHEDTSVSLAQNLNTLESEFSGPSQGEDGDGSVAISGELKKWHRTDLTLDGPAASESGVINPFTNYRMNVTFTHQASGTAYVVPGYFAADGNAANTGANSGNQWRAHLAADQEGVWNYSISFRTGSNVSVNESPTAGTALAPYDGVTGQFTIGATDKTGDDFRGKGRLVYVGEHYLQFAETGEYFLKQGTDAPENLLAYADFDGGFKMDGNYNTGTFNNEAASIKEWNAHVGDWNPGDPTWTQVDGDSGTFGKGLIGAVNYLASEQLNAFSFLTMNIEGDDRNVYPYTTYSERSRLDVSKLDQWEIVFEHGDRMGMYLHFKTQETENDQLLDGGNLGNERKLYYRELIARFSHHLGMNWNLGEETSNTEQQIKDFAQYFHDHDPYQHNVVLHTYPNQKDQRYTPLLGDASELTGVSLQTNQSDFSNVHADTATWVANSANAGKKWVVAVDEPGDAQHALRPDNDAGNSHTDARKNALWGTFMAGGAGNEWYFGYAHAHSDLTAEDFRSRDDFWDYTRHAKSFFEDHNIPFWEMQNDNSISTASNDYGFYKSGEVYTVYLKNGGTTNLNLSGVSGTFDVSWFDPRNGGNLQAGTVTQIEGGSNVSLGLAPNSTNQDWAILVTARVPGTAPTVAAIARDDFLVSQPELVARPDKLQTVIAAFSEDVNIDFDDLVLFDHDAVQFVEFDSPAGFSYDTETFTAVWDFDTLISDQDPFDPGYYGLYFNSVSISSVATGELLDGDGNGQGGGLYAQDVYVAIPGDVNLDGVVDISKIEIVDGVPMNIGDASILLANLGNSTGQGWQQGDFNGDGDVDVTQLVFDPSLVNVGDASVLLANLGKSAVPPAILSVSSSASVAPSSALAVPQSTWTSVVPVVVQPMPNGASDDFERLNASDDSVAVGLAPTVPCLAGNTELDEAFAGHTWDDSDLSWIAAASSEDEGSIIESGASVAAMV